MKEATGELSTTAIAIVAIGLILAIFTTILLPMIRSQVTLNQACNSGPGYSTDKVCCTALGVSDACRPAGVANNATARGTKTCSGSSVSATNTNQTFICAYYD